MLCLLDPNIVNTAEENGTKDDDDDDVIVDTQHKSFLDHLRPMENLMYLISLRMVSLKSTNLNQLQFAQPIMQTICQMKRSMRILVQTVRVLMLLLANM